MGETIMYAALDQITPLVPSDNEAAIAKQAADVLRPLSKQDIQLVRRDDPKIVVPLPARVVEVIVHMLDAMSQGKAFSVIPHETELTTQQAADYLNVSRPFLTNLIDRDKIPHRMVGRHRRIKFADLLAFEEQSKRDRHAAILAMAEEEEALGLD
jgi:excisionase family DNA binding protein